jgi:hypothetical protein
MMAEKMWISEKIQYCDHAGCDVSLEAETIFPAEHLPDQPPRVTIHRCSNAMECCNEDRSACVWNGTNPNYDPFVK